MTRLPKEVSTPKKASSSATRSRKAANDKYCSPVSSSRKLFNKPKSGCWLCPATDHYCNDRSKHPVNAQGMYEMPSPQDKKAIMSRIATSKHPAEWKEAEKKRVSEFWSRRCAP